MNKSKKIIERNINFSDWYTSIVKNAKLAIYGPIKGTMFFLPTGWAIWENIQKNIDLLFKEIGVENISLPLLIPMEDFQKEKEQVEGFAPELYVVTKIGDKELNQEFVIRPTSEILFCKYFSHILTSYKDLPIIVNQWCNVMRAEKTTRPFLRNSEFHWQELHAIFDNKKDTVIYTKTIIKLYQNFLKDFLAIPTLMGKKTIGEKFGGAEETFTIEAIMQDGQVLQCGTSHYLDQNFSKTNNIKFQGKDNSFEFVYQMSAGISTRLIGALIMTHSDDNGLVLPPKIAPVQIILNIINFKNDELINSKADEIYNDLKNDYRIKIDNSDKGLGYKILESEIIGIPIQLIVGKEALDNQITVYRRDLKSKEIISINKLVNYLSRLIIEIQKNLLVRAENQLEDSIKVATNVDQLNKILKDKKLAKVFWFESLENEMIIKELTGATPRCIISYEEEGNCFYSNKKTNLTVIFGRAY